MRSWAVKKDVQGYDDVDNDVDVCDVGKLSM